MTISKIFQNIKMELERVQRVQSKWRQLIQSMLSIKSTRPPLNLRWKCPFWLNWTQMTFPFFRKDYYTKSMVRVDRYGPYRMVRGIFITNLFFFTIWMHQLLQIEKKQYIQFNFHSLARLIYTFNSYVIPLKIHCALSEWGKLKPKRKLVVIFINGKSKLFQKFKSNE